MIQYAKMTNKMQLCRIIYYSLAALQGVASYFKVEIATTVKLERP